MAFFKNYKLQISAYGCISLFAHFASLASVSPVHFTQQQVIPIIVTSQNGAATERPATTRRILRRRNKWQRLPAVENPLSENAKTHPEQSEEVTAKNLADNGGAASAKGSNGTESIASSKLGLKVEYPRLSRILGEEGHVLIALKLSGPRASVLTSSGHVRLDQAALLAVQNGMMTGNLPAQLSGKTSVQIGFVFKLTDPNRLVR